MKYTVTHSDGYQVVIKADSEEKARRKAMIKRYGEFPSNVVLHAPEYRGQGLIIEEHETDTTE